MADLLIIPNNITYAKNLLPVSYNLEKDAVISPSSGSGSATIGDSDFFAVYGNTSLHLFNSSLTTSAATFSLGPDFQARVNEDGIYPFTFYVYVPSTMSGSDIPLSVNIYVNGVFEEMVTILLSTSTNGFAYDTAIRYIISRQYNADDEIDFTYTLGQDASAPFPGGRAFLSAFKLELRNQNQPYAGIFIPVDSEKTGWARYSDATFTSGAPQGISAAATAVIANDGSTTETDFLPSYLSNFYSLTTQKFVKGTSDTMGNSLGDFLTIEIKIIVKSTVSNDYFKILLDVGGTEGVIASETKRLSVASGNYESFFAFFSVPITADFLSNGGSPKITATAGDLSIYGASFTVSRTHKS